MWNDGRYILWQHIAQLFYEDTDNGLKLLPKLTQDHIKLNSYSVMRVNLVQLFYNIYLQHILFNKTTK